MLAALLAQQRDYLIQITEVPDWILWPFIAILVVALIGTVTWILRSPEIG